VIEYNNNSVAGQKKDTSPEKEMSIAEMHQGLQSVKKSRVSKPHQNLSQQKHDEEDSATKYLNPENYKIDKPRKDWSAPLKMDDEGHQESAMETDKEVDKAGKVGSDLDDIGVSSLAHAVESLKQKISHPRNSYSPRNQKSASRV